MFKKKKARGERDDEEGRKSKERCGPYAEMYNKKKANERIGRKATKKLVEEQLEEQGLVY